MRPPASSPDVRRRMQAVRRRHTVLEMRLRSALHRMGFRYRVDRSPLPEGEAAGGPGVPDRARRRVRRRLFLARMPYPRDVAQDQCRLVAGEAAGQSSSGREHRCATAGPRLDRRSDLGSRVRPGSRGSGRRRGTASSRPTRIRRTVDSIDPAHGPPGSRRGASGCVRNESRGQSAIGTCGWAVVPCPRHAGRSSTPVICETLADAQGVVGQGLVHRHQLDRGDTEALQVADYGRVGQPRIRALQLRRYIRMKLREAADMGLVDDRVRVRGLRGPVPLLVESRIYYDRTDRVWRAVGHAGPQRGEIHLVSEQRVGSTDRAVNRLGVRVQERLRGLHT